LSVAIATSRSPSDRRALLLVVVGAFLLALAFALHTRHAWEDYYITFRSSKNLVQGHGLVFTPGERVHSFTSPLGVLLPAFCSWVTGGNADQAALWLFRVMGAAALAGAAGLVFAGLSRVGAGRAAPVLGAAFLACEAKALDFSTNGMETGFLLLFIAYAFWALAAPGPGQWRHLGVSWAGIMWTRPDGFIYIGLLGAGFGACSFFGATWPERRATFVLLARAALVCALLYLPWFVWAWTYYGSPVPHTIIAKGSLNAGRSLGGFLTAFATLPFKLWTGQTTVEGALLPAYYQGGGWPGALHHLARVLGAVALLAWCWPGLRPPVRAASLAFHGAHAYLTYFPYFPFPWYFPSTGILAAIAWGGVLGSLGAARPGWRRLGLATAGLMLLFEGALSVASAVQMRAKQEIAYGNLRRIGEWLRTNARPADHVFLEPLGYIGYFSQLRTCDFPGLSSPRMVEARRVNGNGWGVLLLSLRPEWVVLRPHEEKLIRAESASVLTHFYAPVRVFDVTAAAAAARVPDRFMLQFDSHFTLYRCRVPLEPEQEILGAQHPFGNDAPVGAIDGTQVRLVHAPGSMSLRVPADATRFAVRFGFFADAYQGEEQTDGATFSVVWFDGAERRVLATRTLDPANRPDDRGMQSFTGALPAGATGRARLLLRTEAGRSNTKDWTCWGRVDFDPAPNP